MTDERPRMWVGHVVLATHDLPRAHDFYRSLGLRAFREPGPEDVLIELEMRGGTHLVLVFDPQARIHNRVAPFDLMCDNTVALHDELSARGIEVTAVRHDHHGDFTFRDPDGYIVTVNQSHVEGAV